MKLSPAVTEKVLVAIVSASLGGLGTYMAKTLLIEGRLDAIERAVNRIEQRLFPPAASSPPSTTKGA